MDEKTRERIQTLRDLKRKALSGSGVEHVEKQHNKGKLTARERIEKLVDPGSFREFNMLTRHTEGTPNDGIVAGIATVEERLVCIYSQDATSAAGTIGTLHGYKMYRTIERALELGVPFIGLHDSPGIRIEKLEQFEHSLRFNEAAGRIFLSNTQASGVIPQISAVLGSCAGIAVYSPALTDFVFMVDGISHMFITGPKVVKSVMFDDVSMEDLGGSRVHAQVTGMADFRSSSEAECFQSMKELLTFLPSNCRELPPLRESNDDPERVDDTLAEIVPSDPKKPYDMHRVIQSLLDNGKFLEVKREFAKEMIVGFGHLGSMPVGIIANQPLVAGGSLTVNGSKKEARFIRFCDAFNIPILLLVDTPAYQPGAAQQNAGIISHGAAVLYALCEATVPRIATVLRKCYGGGGLGMGVTPGLQTDVVFYWPTAERATIGAEQVVDLLYQQQIANADNQAALRAQLIKEHEEKYTNPSWEISYNVYVQDIIEPRETRRELIRMFKYLRSKKVTRYPKRHGCIPLL